MGLIRRKWTPSQADDWTREDWIAIFLSPLAYLGLAVGVALSLLMRTEGWIVLLISILLIVVLHWIIDPKLKTISAEYERKQKQYLEELERIERWEDLHE